MTCNKKPRPEQKQIPQGNRSVDEKCPVMILNIQVLLCPSGWYVVWQLFLSKFKFLRELVGDASTPQAETQPSETKTERTANAPTRNRPRTARQRVAVAEST